MSLAWSAGAAEVDQQGRVLLRIEPAGASLRLGLAPDPGLREILVEDDVVEHAGSGDYQLSQRVTTAGEHCQLRWLAESSAAAVTVELGVEVPPGCHAWVWPSGADALFAVFPEAGLGPVLLVQVVQGSLTWSAESDDGRRFRLLLAELQPEDRRETVLRARSIPTLAYAEDLLPSWYQPLVLGVGEGWEADVADFGVDADDHVRVELIEAAVHPVAITAPPGRHRVGLHGRRGVTELVLEMSPEPEQVTARFAEAVLEAPPATWTSADAVVVLKAVEFGVVASDRHVEDALDRFDWTSRGDPLAIIFGCRRAMLEDERAMVEEAIQQLAALPDRRLQAQARRIVAFVAAAMDADLEPLRGLMRPVRNPVLADHLDSGRRTAAGAALLGGAINRLCAGLPGRPVGLGPTAMAELVVLVESCPEPWGEASMAGHAADEGRLKLFAGYAAGEITDTTALAWLLIGG